MEKSRKLVKLEAWEQRMLDGGGNEVGKDAETEAMVEAAAFDWMDRVEAAADHVSGEMAPTGALDAGVQRVARRAGVPESEIWTALSAEGGEELLRMILMEGLQQCGDTEVLRWLSDNVTGTDGRDGKPLTAEEAGMQIAERAAEAEDVVRGREGGTVRGGHWWD